ncbi:MAG TPA: (d)CMP kinase, partial [Tepidisphaeraceae bacterium]|nr:(d)CMP kinase [Tepidisphaeraceae bacterium]
REMLVAQQQEIGRQRPDLVTEGRDQGSVVFPDAELKFYLDATPQERARRRVAQLRARGEIVDYQEILNNILARDHRDATRATGPLVVPADAETIDTTAITQSDVIERIVAAAAERRGAGRAAETTP